MNPEIEIKTFYAGSDRPLEVQVSFVMSYHDWCLFQKSNAWKTFQEVLSVHQKINPFKEKGENTMCKRGTTAQLEELEKSDDLFLTPDQVAAVIGCDPQSIRGACETVEGFQRIGFPATRLGARTYIPRMAFIRWVKGELGGGAIA